MNMHPLLDSILHSKVSETMPLRFWIIFILLNVAFEINANLDCKTTKWSDARFDGKLGPKTDGVSESECITRCWNYDQQYAAQGYPCKSFNYIKASKTCQMIFDKFVDGTGLKADPASNYIIVNSCQTSGPTQTPKPTQPPIAGSTNIRPGSCGQSSVPQVLTLGQRIVGGVEARQHSIPFIISMRKSKNAFHFCGGTLLRVSQNREETDIAVTAAHCIFGKTPDFYVVAGAHYAFRSVTGEVSMNVTQVVKHPKYNHNYGMANDIALIKLDQPIKFSQTIQPACLPAGQQDRVRDGQIGVVAGWGHTLESGQAADPLMQVPAPVINSETCRQMQYLEPDTMFCAGYELGQKDACQGDSGGPYFVQGKSGYTLQGIVSWGIGCARPQAPGVYSIVANYVDWIQEQIKILSSIRP